MRRFRFALGLAAGAVALVLADRRFGSQVPRSGAGKAGTSAPSGSVEPTPL